MEYFTCFFLQEKNTQSKCISEFLLGDRILAAPVISPDAKTRDVYLPRGKWTDPNQNKTYVGPLWLMEYPAPLDVLPYFILDSNQ